MATENPIEQQGTYPLPEAQVDRFMLKLLVDYPSRDEERLILDRMSQPTHCPTITPQLEPEELLSARKTVEEIYIDEKIKDYILSLIFATREPEEAGLKIGEFIQHGASPRANDCAYAQCPGPRLSTRTRIHHAPRCKIDCPRCPTASSNFDL